MTTPSPLLDLPGAVDGAGIDAGVAAHYGSFNAEQRTLVSGEGFVDLSHRDVVRISGPDRLTWLHSLTSQHLSDLPPGTQTQALILSPNGHIGHHFFASDDGEVMLAHCEPGAGAALVEFLDRMRFMLAVEVELVTEAYAVAWRPDNRYHVMAREELQNFARATGPACGLWAFEALRIERGEPRIGIDTDHKTIPNEIGLIGPAVHLEKGCYRGQETVARVYNLGRPPRRLTMLHLDGSENVLPERGTALTHNERQVGFVGSSARHFELGPIALGLIKRGVAVDAQLDADGHPVAQEVIVDPEICLHFRPMR